MSGRYATSAIYRMAGDDPMSEARKDELARAAWRAGADLVTLRLSEIRCAISRQVILNEMARQHGERPKKR